MIDTPAANASRRADVLATCVGVAAIIALILMMSRWVGNTGQPVTFEALWTLATALPLAGVWVAAAIGIGWPLQRVIVPKASVPLALQVGMGVAGMLIIDAALGALGVLASPVIAWLIVACGLGLLLAQSAAHLRTMRLVSLHIPLPAWLAWGAAPAIAALLMAACSAPGWLWSSEFGGYDALSYHLQLPKEWLALGRVQPLEHNVYSFLPGYVESAYLHIMALRTDAMAALYACQMLHALLTLTSAWMGGMIVARISGRAMGGVATALYLATPWTIVVGSLAYNEMAVNLLLAAGLLVAGDEKIASTGRGIAIGLLGAAAVGSKLTSVGFVVAPLGLLLLLALPPRRWPLALVTATITGIVCLLPWLLRNFAHGSNPLFPFATSLLGAAHWSAEQVATFHRGHMPDATLAQRVAALWKQFLSYGIGSNPDPKEPWQPQWGTLPWLGLLGGLIAMMRPWLRRDTLPTLIVLLTQVAFWLFFTHLKSRFLLPAAVPLSILTMLGLRAALGERTMLAATSPTAWLIAVVLLGAAVLPVRVFSREGSGAPALAIGAVDSYTGDSPNLTDDQRRDLGTSLFPAIAVNHLLPSGSKVLLVGEAAPLYDHLDRIVYNTVWDRGPLSRIMREQANDPEAWKDALRAMGFTHVLVNPTMLVIWQREGWNDPLITRQSVRGFLETAAEPLFDYPRPSQITIYRLQD